MRVRVFAVWSGISSAWFVEPPKSRKRTNAMVDGLVRDPKIAFPLRLGDEIDLDEPVAANADSYDTALKARAYLVIGEPVEDDFG